jgi:iron(III) transport system substrate-binding protein
LLCCFVFLFALAVAGCRSENGEPDVTLYCSVDQPFARQVVAAFMQQTHIPVRIKLDTEAGKTTGLVRRIRAERRRPRADVFWSSELFQTIKLANDGLLAEYRPPAEGVPDRYRDPGNRWTAFGLRARVLAYNSSEVNRDELPTRWRDITDARWQGKLGIADPRFGTTGGHFAAMYVLWGEAEYVKFLAELKRMTGGQLQDGNATAARRVGRGELLVCATDTDDVYARQRRGEPVDMVYPDLGDGGTLLVPNSVALLAGAPNVAGGKKLIDFLASEVTERMLARSDSRNIPVRASLRKELEMDLPPETRIGFQDIANALEPALRLAGEHLIP